MIASALSYAGWEALKGGVSYTGKVVGGAYGRTLMNNTVSNFTNYGAKVAGPVGAAIGNVLGKGAAGLAVNEAAKQAQAVSAAINTIGMIGVDLAQKQASKPKKVTPLTEQTKTPAPQAPQPEGVAAPAPQASQPEGVAAPAPQAEGVAAPAPQAPQAEGIATPAPQAEGATAPAAAPAQPETSKTNWGDMAFKTAHAVGTLALAGALMATGAGVLVPLAVAAATSAPDILDAIVKNAPLPSEVSFIDDVVAPLTTQLAIGALGSLAGGIASYNVVEGAYADRVKLGAKIGSKVDSILPEYAQGFFKAVGTSAGIVDGNRVAMAPATIEKAINVGVATKQAVEVGLQVTNAVVQSQMASSKGATGWAETARKTAWVGGGIVAGGVFTVLAPELAVVAGGAALFGVLPKAIQYSKATFLSTEASEPKTAEETPVAADVDPKVTILDGFNMDDVMVDYEPNKSQVEVSKDKVEGLNISSLMNSMTAEDTDSLLKSWVTLPAAAAA